MVKSQKLPMTIVRHPTVREKDGLAMSSRNARLSALGRKRATLIYRALQATEQLYQSGEHRRRLLEEAVIEVLQKEKSLTIDYVAIVDAETLKKITIVRREALVAVAVYLEGVRLIDNCILVPSKIRSAA
jgi:pantoate--beta-alanine ligase